MLISELQPYQYRVTEEVAGVRKKLGYLTRFIEENETFKTLPEDEQERMIRQRFIMQDYIAVLDERIAHFA